MVIEFTEEILKYLEKSKPQELEKIVLLIENNIKTSRLCSVHIQNFIYLSHKAIQFLNEKFSNTELEFYEKNLTSIISSVYSLERLVVVEKGKKIKRTDLEYEYSFISRLIGENTKIIIENINDELLYDCIIEKYLKEDKLEIKVDYQNGNGSQTLRTLENNVGRGKISVVITDRDQKFYNERNERSTPTIIENFINSRNLPDKHLKLEYKNIEGLVPYKKVIEYIENDQNNNKTKDIFDLFYKNAIDKNWLYYFDFKEGLGKNLTQKIGRKRKDYLESLEWWREQIKNIDISGELDRASSDDIIKSGLGISLSKINLTKDDIISKSSMEQKKEYERITTEIYPWIISNEYIGE